MGRATEKDWLKRPPDRSPAVRGLERLWWARTSCGGGNPCPCAFGAPWVPASQQRCHLHAQLSLGQSCHSHKKSCVCVCRDASVMSGSLQPCRLRAVFQASMSGKGFSRQEYWSISANTGCHTLLEHCISFCLSHQLPWVPNAARTPVTQAAVPTPQLAPTGANPSAPGQLPSLFHCSTVDDPHVEVEIKHSWNPRAVWLRKKTQNLPISSTSCRLNPHDQLGRLCLWDI